MRNLSFTWPARLRITKPTWTHTGLNGDGGGETSGLQRTGLAMEAVDEKVLLTIVNSLSTWELQRAMASRFSVTPPVFHSAI